MTSVGLGLQKLNRERGGCAACVGRVCQRVLAVGLVHPK